MIVLGGSVAQRSDAGGHVWVFLHYLLGFRRLGHDVVLIDRLEPSQCVDRTGAVCAPERSVQVRRLASIMSRFGLSDDWAVLVGDDVVGKSRRELQSAMARSEAFVNVMGFIDDADLLRRANNAVFLDIDPGFPQLWLELGWHDAFAGHDRFVTIGENIGRSPCDVPSGGIDWLTTKQPVVLEHWPVAAGPGSRVTTVGAWRGPNDPIEFHGRRHGLRAHAMRELLDLPSSISATVEVALDIDPWDVADRDSLVAAGWRLVQPAEVSDTPEAYRDYVRGSAAELMIAKELYTLARTGWFSDRSATYLASGRPVVASDTGLVGHLPLGAGLVVFDDLDGAVAGVESVLADLPRHQRSARDIAEEYFDSDRVLADLLDRVGCRP